MSGNCDCEIANAGKVSITIPILNFFIEINADFLILAIQRSDTDRNAFQEELVFFVRVRGCFDPRVIMFLDFGVQATKLYDVEIHNPIPE
jgi:hypothetical protein